MLLGILLLKKRYVWTKYLAVVMITVGIATCTIASTQYTQVNRTQKRHCKRNRSISCFLQSSRSAATNNRPFIGVCLLTFSLIAAARMGIYQETLFTRYGKHPREALFYCVSVALHNPRTLPHAATSVLIEFASLVRTQHALPLPGFLILYSDIYSHAVAFNASAPITVPLLLFDIVMPKVSWLRVRRPRI